MANERVKLKRGPSEDLPTEKEAGSILIETDTGVAYVDNTSTDRVQIKDPTKLPLTGGEMEGDIEMGENSILVDNEPTEDNEVANKKYVDDQMAEAGKDVEGEAPIKATTDEEEHKVTVSLEKLDYNTTDKNVKLDYGDSFDVVTGESLDDYGRVKEINRENLTLPDAVTHVAEADHATTADYADAVSGTIEHAQTADTADKLSEKFYINGIPTDGSNNVCNYGTCDTDGDVQNKEVEADGYDDLGNGQIVAVYFANTNEVDYPTMTVGNCTDLPIRFGGEQLVGDTASYIKGGHTYWFVNKNDRYFDMVESPDTSSNSGLYTECYTVSSDANKEVAFENLDHLDVGERIAVQFEESNTASDPTLTVYSVATRYNADDESDDASPTSAEATPASTGIQTLALKEDVTTVVSEVPIRYQGSGATLLAEGVYYDLLYTGTTFEVIAAPAYRRDAVEPESPQFRNVVVVSSDTDVNTLNVPVGTIIFTSDEL